MFINFLNNYLIYTLVEFLENKNNSIHFFSFLLITNTSIYYNLYRVFITTLLTYFFINFLVY